MKKLTCTAALALFSLVLNAQIKVYTGGGIAMGNTGAAPFGNCKTQFFGNTVFSSTTGSSTSSAYIRGLNAYSSATTPDYTWRKDSTTGIYHAAGGEIDFTTSGTQRLNLSNYQLSLSNLANGLEINSAGTWPNLQITVPSSGTASANYGYVMSFGTSNVFYVLATGDVFYKNGWVGSDSSFKKNVVAIPNALKKINKLRGVNFKYNYNNEGLNDPNELAMGLIAQEVERVVPEVVKLTREGTKAVSYQSLVGLLVEGIKEQSKITDSLTKVTNKQDSINQALQNQINNIITNCCNSGASNRTRTQGTRSSEQLAVGGNQPAGNNNQSTTVSSGTAENSTNAMLYQNIPNPFNQTTVVKCFVPQSSQNASLLVFDLNGSLKKSFTITDKGMVNITINGNQLVSGMYYYTLLIDGQEIDTKKMILTE